MSQAGDPERGALAATRVSTGDGARPDPGAAAMLRSRGITPETLVTDRHGTLACEALTVTPSSASDPFAALRDAEPLRLGPVLGEGAMGLVRIGEQPALHRQVAVKQIHPAAPADDATAALLREGWVAAGLEHPNIVPVHALHVREGAPLLVMKHIEGTAWSEVLRDPSGFNVADPTAFHVDVLVTVCHAVHFAHARGVVHLDLKPDNVMLGAFGEVYVLDWGLASAYRDGHPAWMRHVREITKVCGTPHYLAPEQAVGEGERFGVTTDVYLLGAILHQIVTGRPLHDCDSVFDALVHAYEGAPPSYGPEISPELAHIVTRATAREPQDRYPSVEALRLALEGYLRHRSSDELVTAALERLEQVRAAVAEDKQTTTATIELGNEAALQRAISECRFGLQQALRVWPDNAAAADRLQELLTLLIERAIHLGDWTQAVAALDELPRPDPALAAAVDALGRRARQQRAAARELRDLKRDLDLDTQWRARFRFTLAIGPVWLLWNGLSGLLHRSGVLEFDYPVLLTGAVFTNVLFLVGRKMIAKSLLTTRVNRHGMWLLGAGIFAATVQWAMCAAVGVPLMTAVGLTVAVDAFFLVAIAAVIDARTAWSLPIALPFALLVPYWPEYAFEVTGILGLIGAWSLAWVWRRPTRDGDDDGQGGQGPRQRAPSALG